MTTTEERIIEAHRDPELGHLSNRALAEHLGVSEGTVRRYRPRPAAGERRTARNGARVRARRPRRVRDPVELAVDIPRAAEERARLQRDVAALEAECIRERNRADAMVRKAERLEAQVEELQSSLSKARRANKKHRDGADGRATALLKKLIWLCFEREDAQLAMTDGLLVTDYVTLELSNSQRHLFTRTYTQVEGEVDEHWKNQWNDSDGYDRACAAAKRRGIAGQHEVDEYAGRVRDAWINERVDAVPWPWD